MKGISQKYRFKRLKRTAVKLEKFKGVFLKPVKTVQLMLRDSPHK